MTHFKSFLQHHDGSVCYLKHTLSSIIFYLVEPGTTCSIQSALVSPAPRCIQCGDLHLVDHLTMLEGCQWRAGKQRMDFTEGKSAVGGGGRRDGQGQVGCCQRLPENHTSHLAFHPPARCLGLDTVSTPCTAIRAIPWCHHGEKNQPLQYCNRFLHIDQSITPNM